MEFVDIFDGFGFSDTHGFTEIAEMFRQALIAEGSKDVVRLRRRRNLGAVAFFGDDSVGLVAVGVNPMEWDLRSSEEVGELLSHNTGMSVDPGVGKDNLRVGRSIVVLLYQMLHIQPHCQCQRLGVSIVFCVNVCGALEEDKVIRRDEEWDTATRSANPSECKVALAYLTRY